MFRRKSASPRWRPWVFRPFAQRKPPGRLVGVEDAVSRIPRLTRVDTPAEESLRQSSDHVRAALGIHGSPEMAVIA